ncbi:MAG TPA: hypothetical protein VNB03_13425, partial [Casimicrobiaceae bacterium]|nr:hypothetical protein [Casimicrobiaceae bacterium]
MREKVRVTETGTRDGFQAEHAFIPTEAKADVIDALVGAGLRHIEATSFVSPKAVPQLADAHEVIARLKRRAEAHLAALAPNARGAERALAAGVDEIVVFVSPSVRRSMPSSAYASTRRSAASTGTSPSNGQPNAQAIAPRSGARPATTEWTWRTLASEPSISALRFATLC